MDIIEVYCTELYIPSGVRCCIGFLLGGNGIGSQCRKDDIEIEIAVGERAGNVGGE